MKIYINGKLVDKAKAQISVFDHGLLYGDGVFEGVRSYNRSVFKLDEHIDRLFESAHTIMLDIPLSKKELKKAILNVFKVNGLKDGYVRLVVTRGEGDLGLDPRKCTRPTIIMIADKITFYPEKIYREGMELITAATRRNAVEALNPQIKSLNYLNNILAKIEATHRGVQEALMLNSDGYVAECTGDNIFIIKNKNLITPAVYAGALKGITRDTIMDIARTEKINVFMELISRHDLFNADECFLTGTAAEIVPVVKIDGRIIADGALGKTTLKFMKAFKKLTRTEGVKY